MSSPRRTWITLASFVLVAFCLHSVHAYDMQIGFARPNMIVMAMLVGCLFLDSTGGAILGFLCGGLEASFTGIFIGSILVSRSMVGFALGALEERIYRDNVLVCTLLTLLGTLAVEAVFFLFAPQPHVARWATGIAGESSYNAGLALPSYMILRRLIRGRRARGLAAVV